MGDRLSPGLLAFLMTSKPRLSALWGEGEALEAFSYSAMRLRDKGRGVCGVVEPELNPEGAGRGCDVRLRLRESSE